MQAVKEFTSINDLLSKELYVEPLKENETASFRLIRAGFMDPMTGKPASPSGHSIPGLEVIFDKVKKANVRIMNIKEFVPTQVNGQTIYEPKAAGVYFGGSSTITCTVNENDQYLFLKRTSYNRDNPFRSKKYPPIFFEVNVEKDAQVNVSNTEYKRLALNIVADSNDKELISIAYALNEAKQIGVTIDMNQKGPKLRAAMNNVAESYSEQLILASEDDDSKLRIWIDRAISDVVIMFDPHESKRQWIWLRDEKSKAKKSIVKITEGNDPIKGLIDYLLSADGSEHKAELVTRVAKEETYVEA